jgi:ATP-dependent helicase/nuclease subunit A
MTDSGVISLPLPDAAARARVVEELDTNLLVEAGAGSGKTTALVARMVALITSGSATVDQIAAVTFTRKAAGELRERFQTRIEGTIRAGREAEKPDTLVLDRLGDALDEIDRAFIGTIHSFCGRLLRERPLEIGLDPGFQELPVEERGVLRARFWESYLERLTRDSDPILEELSRSGLRPRSLSALFDHLVENPDVRFPAALVDPPGVAEVSPIRAELEEIVSNGWELMDDLPSSGDEWDPLQKKIRQLHFERDISGWSEPADLFEAIALLCKQGKRGHDVTLKRWRAKDLAKALKERVDAFGVGDTPANEIVSRWYAHRYALAIRLGRRAADEFAEHRLRLGKLDFQDLLILAARLLRSDRDVRRQLGLRYRRVLVDEFQDTDPLQAEIMLLLSSEPARLDAEDDEGPASEEESVAEWREAVPRPGALFVVGDPKQSIYRFRRADIRLYAFVKERFEDFGEVVSLSANFRSRPAIGDLVNDVFSGEGFFPAAASAEQAAFERLDTRPPSEPLPIEGVFTYSIAPERANKLSAAEDDSGRIATWIRDRVDGGERDAGDFLILTRGRGRLSVYARALEAHGLPVQVTGAGVGVENEIHELKILLECMIDPTNPVKVVSALVGLFFGVDYERLVAHRLEGGSLDAMRAGDRGHPEVIGALHELQRWWRTSVSEPADIFVSRLVSELGLLPYAASGDLGSLRAGALLFALDAVRSAALRGDASLPGALSALESALDLKEAEAPLEPGRADAIRLMNLHQAKGLEGTVVVLADPTEPPGRRPELHLTRSDQGAAEGFLRVTPATSGWRPKDVARPLGWAAKEEAEKRFEDAEEVRLLYVAATRAREELVVARWPGGRKASAWSVFEPWLDENAEALDLESREPPSRPEIEITAVEAGAAIEDAVKAVASRRVPTFRHSSVTDVAKKAVDARGSAEVRRASESDRAAFRGLSWGSAVHGALAAAARDAGAESLRASCRDVLVQYERPLDDHGEPTELAELVELVGVVLSSELWTRAQAAQRVLSEIAFAAPDVRRQSETEPMDPESAPEDAESRRQLDLFAASKADSDEQTLESDGAGDGDVHPAEEGAIEPARTVLEGVIDLAFKEDDGWVIADYKTDVGTDPDFSSREETYRRQVELYADAWERLTGEAVKERVLFFTSQKRVERW